MFNRLGLIIVLLCLWSPTYAAEGFTERDRVLAMSAMGFGLVQANPGEIVQWENPHTGAAGSFLVERRFHHNGSICTTLVQNGRNTTVAFEPETSTVCQTQRYSWDVAGDILMVQIHPKSGLCMDVMMRAFSRLIYRGVCRKSTTEWIVYVSEEDRP